MMVHIFLYGNSTDPLLRNLLYCLMNSTGVDLGMITMNICYHHFTM